MTKLEKIFYLRIIKRLSKYTVGVSYKFIRYQDNYAIQLKQGNKSFIIDGINIDTEYTFSNLMENIKKCLSD